MILLMSSSQSQEILAIKYFSIYKRDDGEPEFELRQLSNLSPNDRDSRFIGKCSRPEVEAWLQLRADRLVQTVDGDEVTPSSILTGLDLLCSAKFALRD